MSALTILRHLLLEAPAVSAIVDYRVFAVLRPQESALPAIVIDNIFEAQDQRLTGAVRGYTNRLEVQCLAASIAGADTLAEAVKDSLELIWQTLTTGSPPEVEAVVQYVAKEGTDVFDYTEEPGVYRRTMDYSLRWQR